MIDSKKCIYSILIFLFCSLTISAQRTTILKPGPKEGIDARISIGGGDIVSHLTNYGNYEHIIAREWTTSLNPVTYRTLFDFNLDFLKPEDSIVSASLNLFFGKGDWDGHHSEGVSNAAHIRQVITPWEEDFVTWQTQPSSTTVDEVWMKASTHEHEDYIGIDLTKMVRKEVRLPDRYHGFMLKLEQETPYNRLLFASSDHPNSDLHPELVVSYIEGTTSSMDGTTTEMVIFPNPVSDRLTVEGSLDGNTVSIKSFDGRYILTVELLNGQLDVSFLKTGYYFLQGEKNGMPIRERFYKL